MSETTKSSNEVLERIKAETAEIEWHDLARYYASGKAIFVAEEMDLVDVAYQMTQDNKEVIENWLKEGKINQVTDEQAKEWFDIKAMVMAVVIPPLVLVQYKNAVS